MNRRSLSCSQLPYHLAKEPSPLLQRDNYNTVAKRIQYILCEIAIFDDGILPKQTVLILRTKLDKKTRGKPLVSKHSFLIDASFYVGSDASYFPHEQSYKKKLQ